MIFPNFINLIISDNNDEEASLSHSEVKTKNSLDSIVDMLIKVK